MLRQPAWDGSPYGVPALAGQSALRGGGSTYCEIQGETTSDRLKPGLHTLRPSLRMKYASYGVVTR